MVLTYVEVRHSTCYLHPNHALEHIENLPVKQYVHEKNRRAAKSGRPSHQIQLSVADPAKDRQPKRQYVKYLYVSGKGEVFEGLD